MKDSDADRDEHPIEKLLFFIGKSKHRLSEKEKYHPGPCQYSNNPWNWRCIICGKLVGDD